MIHEHQFQRQHRTAPRQHFSGGYVEHGRIEPMVEPYDPTWFKWGTGFVCLTVIVWGVFG